MAATGAVKAKLEAKAQAAESKSAGLRMLFDADYTVAQARAVIDVPYGFAYGVAKRHGTINPTPRTAKAKAAPTKATKATKAAPAGKVTKAAKATPAAKATKGKAKAKA